MKRISFYSLLMLFSFQIWAQTPNKFSFQAVVRNSNNEVVVNQNISVKISILQATINGNAVYVEKHNTSTNNNGLMSLEIGNGNVELGTFETIDWQNGPYFIKTETDPSGGTNYSITGTSQLLSVPYALHAKTADNIKGGIVEKDSVFIKSQAFNITANHLQKLNNTSGINTGDQDLSNYATKSALNDSLTKVKSNSPTSLSNLIMDANGGNIKNVANPISAQDAATKAYVDSLKQRLVYLDEILIESDLYKVKDVDGNYYNVKKIGNQLWFKENLKTTKYNDGTNIPQVTLKANWNALSSGAYSWYNNDSVTYKSKTNYIGALYNWYAVNTNKLCPVGWHVPTDEDWKK